MKPNRSAKLERIARARPYPGCWHSFAVPGPQSEEPDLARLNTTEQEELVGLIALSSTPACARCGRSNHDLTRMTDDQLDRMLALLRTLLDRPHPDNGV